MIFGMYNQASHLARAAPCPQRAMSLTANMAGGIGNLGLPQRARQFVSVLVVVAAKHALARRHAGPGHARARKPRTTLRQQHEDQIAETPARTEQAAALALNNTPGNTDQPVAALRDGLAMVANYNIRTQRLLIDVREISGYLPDNGENAIEGMKIVTGLRKWLIASGSKIGSLIGTY